MAAQRPQLFRDAVEALQQDEFLFKNVDKVSFCSGELR
jgi:hypothetical protein